MSPCNSPSGGKTWKRMCHSANFKVRGDFPFNFLLPVIKRITRKLYPCSLVGLWIECMYIWWVCKGMKLQVIHKILLWYAGGLYRRTTRDSFFSAAIKVGYHVQILIGSRMTLGKWKLRENLGTWMFSEKGTIKFVSASALYSCGCGCEQPENDSRKRKSQQIFRLLGLPQSSVARGTLGGMNGRSSVKNASEIVQEIKTGKWRNTKIPRKFHEIVSGRNKKWQTFLITKECWEKSPETSILVMLSTFFRLRTIYNFSRFSIQDT